VTALLKPYATSSHWRMSACGQRRRSSACAHGVAAMAWATRRPCASCLSSRVCCCKAKAANCPCKAASWACQPLYNSQASASATGNKTASKVRRMCCERVMPHPVNGYRWRIVTQAACSIEKPPPKVGGGRGCQACQQDIRMILYWLSLVANRTF